MPWLLPQPLWSFYHIPIPKSPSRDSNSDILNDLATRAIQGVPVYEYPPEMDAWQRRAAWLTRDFITNAKTTKQALEELVRFANGNSCGTKVIHYCLIGGDRPCCDSQEESLCKLLSHVVAFYGRGFQTPLLYRMKHYGAASSWMRFACAFFALFPQALQELQSCTPSNEVTSLADASLTETGFQGVDADFQQLLQDTLDIDQGYAAQNKLRRQLVIEECTKPEFTQGAMVIDVLIQPIEHGINYLLGHTKIIHGLRFLGQGHQEADAMKRRASEKFLHVISGSFSDMLVSKYLLFLEDGGLQEAIDHGLEPDPAMMNKVFQLVTVCMTDIHRRFKDGYSDFPYTLFSLLGLDIEGFVAKWSALQNQCHQCEKCIDPDFSGVLLKRFPGDIRCKPRAEQLAIQEEVTGILRDVSEWTPLTSDSVELLNGYTQWVVSRRGSQHAKAARSSGESTLLHGVVRQHAWALQSASDQTMPPKAVSAGILKMVGVVRDKDWTSAMAISHVPRTC